MRPQLGCGTLAVACVAVPRVEAGLASCVSAGLPGGERCEMKSAGGWRWRQWKGRRVGSRPVAAVGADDALELAGPGMGVGVNSSVEDSVRGREELVSSVGTPGDSFASFRDWYMADKQLVVVSFSAFVTAGFMSILLAAAIPTLIAIKKAAEALEKLADTAREELPGTMAAIRLSGMEISDLTMELNDLGQEISNGVKNSARALNAAESGMRQVGGLAASVWQKQAVVQAQAMQPLVARTAKVVTETLVQSRTLVVNLQIMSRVSSWLGSLQVRTPTLTRPFQNKGQNT